MKNVIVSLLILCFSIGCQIKKSMPTPEALGQQESASATTLSNQTKNPTPSTSADPNRIARMKQLMKQAESEEAHIAKEKELAPSKARTAKYVNSLIAKIRSNIVLPKNITGNPSCAFKVTQLPNGEVESVDLVKSSGNKDLDEAVKLAIQKSSPLPIPEDRTPDRFIVIHYQPQN